MLDTFKDTDVSVMGVPEGKEREKETEYLKKSWLKTSQI